MAVKFNIEISLSTIIFLILNLLILGTLIFLAFQITHLQNSIALQNKIIENVHEQIGIDDHFENDFLPKKKSKFHKNSKYKSPHKHNHMKSHKDKPLHDN